MTEKDSQLDVTKLLSLIPKRSDPKVAVYEVDDRISFSIMDLAQPSYPLVYASSGYQHLTGYSRDELLGKSWYDCPKNSKFVEEPSDPSQRKTISMLRDDSALMKECIEKREEGQFTITNFKKSGEVLPIN